VTTNRFHAARLAFWLVPACAIALTVSACSSSDSPAARASETTDKASKTTSTHGAPDAAASGSTDPAAPSEPTSSAPPDGWPEDLRLPTAIDPTGNVILDSLTSTGSKPAAGGGTAFTFAQGDHAALASSYAGVGAWAEASFEPDPAKPCVKSEATQAMSSMTNPGVWTCRAKLADGRAVEVSTAPAAQGARMTLTVVLH